MLCDVELITVSQYLSIDNEDGMKSVADIEF
jgi:hypothetical protein